MSDEWQPGKNWCYNNNFFSGKELLVKLMEEKKLPKEVEPIIPVVDSRYGPKSDVVIEQLINEEEIEGVEQFMFEPVTKELKKVKEWLPEEFIEASRVYFGRNPIDLVQAEEKLWCAASYVLKLRFLEVGLYCQSHDALKALNQSVVNHVRIKMMDNRGAELLRLAWQKAEKAHKTHYSDNFVTPKKFEQDIGSVEAYVDEMMSLEKPVFEDAVKMLRTDENVLINKVRQQKKKFCGKEHIYEDEISTKKR